MTKITGGVYLEEDTLTFDATQDWDVRASPVAKVTLTANVTFDAPTNPTTGQFISIVYIQDGTGIARVSAVGAGMATQIGTASRMFRALANEDINIRMIATSEIRTTCIVSEKDGDNALKAVHKFFKLGSS